MSLDWSMVNCETFPDIGTHPPGMVLPRTA